MLKILTVVGTRPQFVKASVVSRAIEKHNSTAPGKEKMLREVTLHTGQHYDDNMSRVFYQEMGIRMPDYHLGINRLPHGAMTARMLEEIESVLMQERPDCVVVYGDTNSTLAGALAACKQGVPVVHVEAGLRSFNRRMPEELNRLLVDHAATYLFCPTEVAMENLRREGIATSRKSGGQIAFLTGDVMFDAMLQFQPLARPPASAVPEKFVLATIHRQENTDDPRRLAAIMEAFSVIGLSAPILLPLHPRTRKHLREHGIKPDHGTVEFLEPAGYLEMLYLLRKCLLVMTDSGGLQKEAFFAGKPCITLREETEWVELVEIGANRLSGTDKRSILEAWREAIESPGWKTDRRPYGDGRAAEKIVAALVRELS